MGKSLGEFDRALEHSLLAKLVQVANPLLAFRRLGHPGGLLGRGRGLPFIVDAAVPKE